MSGKFNLKKFSEINIKDSFFDSLKKDYEEFTVWFSKKADAGRKALVFEDEIGVGAFVALKDDECEKIVLSDFVLNEKKSNQNCYVQSFREISRAEDWRRRSRIGSLGLAEKRNRRNILYRI